MVAMSERLRDVLAAATEGRCPQCLRPMATDEHWATTAEGERPDLCWEPYACPWEPFFDADELRAAVVLAWLGERLGDAAVVEAVVRAIEAADVATEWPLFIAGERDQATAALTAVRDALGVPVWPAGGEVAPGEAGDGKGAQIGAEGIEGDA